MVRKIIDGHKMSGWRVLQELEVAAKLEFPSRVPMALNPYNYQQRLDVPSKIQIYPSERETWLIMEEV